ncbi:hypothetical protein ACFTAO_26035 [Paenibacillus rhizoplanae]
MLLVLMFALIAAGCVAIDLSSLKGRQKRRDRVVWGLLWIVGMAATICTLLKNPGSQPAAADYIHLQADQ